MAGNDYLKSIDARLSRIEKKLDLEVKAVEKRVDTLEGIEDRRKGAVSVLVALGTLLSGIAAYVGSNIKDWLA